MTTLDEEKMRAEAAQAQQILSNPLLQRHYGRMRQELIDQLIMESDAEQRSLIWHDIRALDAFFEGLQQYIYTAEALSEELK